jgi:hypothetical protein
MKTVLTGRERCKLFSKIENFFMYFKIDRTLNTADLFLTYSDKGF